MKLIKFGKVLTSKSVGTEPSSYEKRIYRASVSQRLRNTDLRNRRYKRFFSSPYFPDRLCDSYIFLLEVSKGSSLTGNVTGACS